MLFLFFSREKSRIKTLKQEMFWVEMNKLYSALKGLKRIVGKINPKLAKGSKLSGRYINRNVEAIGEEVTVPALKEGLSKAYAYSNTIVALSEKAHEARKQKNLHANQTASRKQRKHEEAIDDKQYDLERSKIDAENWEQLFAGFRARIDQQRAETAEQIFRMVKLGIDKVVLATQTSNGKYRFLEEKMQDLLERVNQETVDFDSVNIDSFFTEAEQQILNDADATLEIDTDKITALFKAINALQFELKMTKPPKTEGKKEPKPAGNPTEGTAKIYTMGRAIGLSASGKAHFDLEEELDLMGKQKQANESAKLEQAMKQATNGKTIAQLLDELVERTTIFYNIGTGEKSPRHRERKAKNAIGFLLLLGFCLLGLWAIDGINFYSFAFYQLKVSVFKAYAFAFGGIAIMEGFALACKPYLLDLKYKWDEPKNWCWQAKAYTIATMLIALTALVLVSGVMFHSQAIVEQKNLVTTLQGYQLEQAINENPYASNPVPENETDTPQVVSDESLSLEEEIQELKALQKAWINTDGKLLMYLTLTLGCALLSGIFHVFLWEYGKIYLPKREHYQVQNELATCKSDFDAEINNIHALLTQNDSVNYADGRRSYALRLLAEENAQGKN